MSMKAGARVELARSAELASNDHRSVGHEAMGERAQALLEFRKRHFKDHAKLIMTRTNPPPNPGCSPGAAFTAALETIRNSISSKGEVAQVRNLISDSAIRDLNAVAAVQYDTSVSAVQFFGGMIHRYPEATFTIKDGKSGKKRSTSRELADFLVVAVFTSPAASGRHVHTGSRACLFQAKLSDAANGPKVLTLDTRKQNTPKKTNPEQFYLLNRWPAFRLKKENPYRSYDLKPFDTGDRPMGKYCYLWKKASVPPATWASSWQCGVPSSGASAHFPLGELLAALIGSAPYVGRDFASPGVNAWDDLMNQLVKHCKVNSWGTTSKLADPAGISFLDRTLAFGTLLQHVPFMRLDAVRASLYGGEYYEDLFRPRFPSSEKFSDDGLPVLVISVSSFVRRPDGEEIGPDPEHKLAGAAYEMLRNLGRKT